MLTKPVHFSFLRLTVFSKKKARYFGLGGYAETQNKAGRDDPRSKRRHKNKLLFTITMRARRWSLPW